MESANADGELFWGQRFFGINDFRWAWLVRPKESVQPQVRLRPLRGYGLKLSPNAKWNARAEVPIAERPESVTIL
jgi:hypothetical protein